MSNSYNMKEFSSTAVIIGNGIYHPSSVSISTINTKCKDDDSENINYEYDPFNFRAVIIGNGIYHPSSVSISTINTKCKDDDPENINYEYDPFNFRAVIIGNGIYHPSSVSISTINTKCKDDDSENINYEYDPFNFRAVIIGNGIYHPSSVSISTINTKCKDDDPENINYEYDPFKNRKLEHPNSDTRSFANLLKSSLGSGILAMPAAFKNAGTVVGIFGTIILGYICTHCVYLLVKTSQDVSRVTKVASLGYAETAEAVFATGPRPLRRASFGVRIFIDLAMAFTILGACAVYVILLVDSVKQVVDHFSCNNEISKPKYCLMFLVPLLLFTQIKNLKYLAPFSAFANILLVLTFVICLYYICLDFPSLDVRPMSVDIGRLPLFIGTVIFAMEGIGVVLPVENTMANPQHFLGCPGVLNITMTVVVVLYMAMGFLGYVRYGDKASGSITLNLPTGEIPALMAKGFIVLAIFFTYTLQFYVPMEIVWRNVNKFVPQRHHNLGQSVMRANFAVFTVALAASTPELEQVIGLEGAFFYSFLGLVAPSLLHVIYCWDRDLGKYKWILIKDVFLVVFGLFVLVTGVTQSIAELTRPKYIDNDTIIECKL